MSDEGIVDLGRSSLLDFIEKKDDGRSVLITDASYIQVDAEGRVIPSPTYLEKAANEAMEALERRLPDCRDSDGYTCLVCGGCAEVVRGAIWHADDCPYMKWRKLDAV